MRAFFSWAMLCLAYLWLPSAFAQTSTLSDNADSIAVVIGNKTYKQTSTVDFAHNDADAIKAYLIGTLGFREQNVFLLKDATLGELTQMFGSEANPQGGRLWRSAVEGRSNVFVYYSGHGVPDLSTRQPFLLPQDGNPNASESGYGLQTLYRNLELVRQKIGAQRQLIVMIDACFTGETGRKGESLLAVSAPGFTPARPRSGGGIVKLVATSGTTPANWDQEAKLGLFTSRFLMGAAGLARAQRAPDSGPLAWADLQRYLKESVAAAARRDSGREQAPEVDEASFALPPGQPVPAVAGAVAAVQDEANWQRAKGAGERSALEDYVAGCRPLCRYRDAALQQIREIRRLAETAADRASWQRLSAAGQYGEYLTGCGPVCAYRELAEDYLPDFRATRDPDVRLCDERAGAPNDPDRNPKFQGVAFADLGGLDIVKACQTATESFPHLRRLTVQLGRAYEKNGRLENARAAYLKAAQHGSLQGMNNVGLLLYEGAGGPKDDVQARHWYEKAVQGGFVGAFVNYGTMLEATGGPGNLQEARRLYERAATGGLTSGIREYGRVLAAGIGGPKDEQGGRKWAEIGAKRGDISAMNDLALLLRDGIGGPVDLPAARQWFAEPTTDLDRVERINRQLAADLGGDNCHNIDRIMRLPGTINVPNAKKRKAGRVPTLAYVVEGI